MTAPLDLAIIRQALERSTATLNPSAGFLRVQAPRSRGERHLESVRADLRAALAMLERLSGDVAQ